MKFKQFNEILAGACTALACLIAFIHLLRHATHLSVPRQQIKYVFFLFFCSILLMDPSL